MATTSLSDQQRQFIHSFIVKLSADPVAEMCDGMQSVVKDELARVSKGNPDAAKAIQDRVDAAIKLRAEGKPEDALRQLMLASEETTALVRAARDAAMQDEVMTGKVSFEALIHQWNARRAELKSQLNQLAGAISKDEDDDDPAGFDVPSKLDQILGKFDNRLTDALDAMRTADGPGPLQKQAGTALAVTREYLGTLDNDPLIRFVADNPYDVDADASAILSEPLYEIESRLRGFAG